MSTALNQSATNLANSVCKENDFPFAEVVAKLAKVQTSVSAVTNRFNLNKQSLRDSVKNEFCGSYPLNYSNGYVSKEIWERICNEVDKFVNSQLGLVHAGNIVSTVSRFKFDNKLSRVDLIHTVTGKDLLNLESQRIGYVCLIADNEKQLKKLLANLTPDYDKIGKCETRITNLKANKAELEKEIQRQQTLTK